MSIKKRSIEDQNMTNNDGRVEDDEIAEDVEEYILCKSCYQKEQYPREDVED